MDPDWQEVGPQLFTRSRHIILHAFFHMDIYTYCPEGQEPFTHPSGTHASGNSSLLHLIPRYQVNQIQLSSTEYDNFGNVQSNTTNFGALAFDTQQELLWVGDHRVRPHYIITEQEDWASNFQRLGSCFVVLWMETGSLHQVPGSST